MDHWTAIIGSLDSDHLITGSLGCCTVIIGSLIIGPFDHWTVIIGSLESNHQLFVNISVVYVLADYLLFSCLFNFHIFVYFDLRFEI